MPTVEYLNYDVINSYDWSIDDADLFEKAANEDLDDKDYGTLQLNEDDSILEAAETEGYNWPFSCRSGGCANCAAALISGEVDMGLQQILSEEEIEDKDIRLTCIGSPSADYVQIIYNSKELEFLQNRVI